MQITVSQLAERLNAEVIGDGSAEITGVASVESAAGNQITFMAERKRSRGLEHSEAGAVITREPMEGISMAQLVVKDVEAALIETLKMFATEPPPPPVGVDPTARVCESAEIADNVFVGPHVIVGEGVCIGQGSVISAGCQIGRNSKLGRNCRLDGNVVLYHNCTLGDNVVIQANTSVGSTGFGYSFIDGEHRLIPHNGGVVIEDDVEIGANCCIDRAKFGNTIIGRGTKIDNLVQIAHNVIIGEKCVIAALTGIAGSTKIGDGVAIGGHVGISDNVQIGSGAMIAAKSGSFKDIAEGQKVAGIPATESRRAMQIMALNLRFPEIVSQLRSLSSRVKKLEAAKDHKE